jgi:hypothetical protein
MSRLFSAYLGESNIGDDDDVKSRRRILLDAGVTSGVVLVGAYSAILLPGLTACSLGDSSFRRGTGGRAGLQLSAYERGRTRRNGHVGELTEVPSCQTENAAHDSEQNL